MCAPISTGFEKCHARNIHVNKLSAAPGRFVDSNSIRVWMGAGVRVEVERMIAGCERRSGIKSYMFRPKLKGEVKTHVLVQAQVF